MLHCSTASDIRFVNFSKMPSEMKLNEVRLLQLKINDWTLEGRVVMVSSDSVIELTKHLTSLYGPWGFLLHRHWVIVHGSSALTNINCTVHAAANRNTPMFFIVYRTCLSVNYQKVNYFSDLFEYMYCQSFCTFL